MTTYSKQLLSGSTNGRPIKVAATATPGTTIHTAVTGTTDMDEIWMWAENTDSIARTLTIEFGGTTYPDDTIIVTVAARSGLVLVIPGWPLQNSLVVKGYASTANVITIGGYVNRISP